MTHAEVLTKDATHFNGITIETIVVTYCSNSNQPRAKDNLLNLKATLMTMRIISSSSYIARRGPQCFLNCSFS